MRGSPDNPDMHIPYVWVKMTGCFERARKNAKRSQASLIFLPGIENVSLSIFLFLPSSTFLSNQHYNSYKRNDFKDESSMIQSPWDTNGFLPMSLSISYLKCVLIWYSRNHSIDDIFNIILKTYFLRSHSASSASVSHDCIIFHSILIPLQSTLNITFSMISQMSDM